MMKRLLICGLLAVLAVACNPGAEHRQAIEKLAADWEDTSIRLQELAGKAGGEQSRAEAYLQAMTVPDDRELAAEQDSRATDLREQVSSQVSTLQQMQQQIAAFQRDWQDRSSHVNALTEGLAANLLNGDVAARIDSLQQNLTDTRSRIDDWSVSLDGATRTYTAAYDNYMALIAQPAPTEQ